MELAVMVAVLTAVVAASCAPITCQSAEPSSLDIGRNYLLSRSKGREDQRKNESDEMHPECRVEREVSKGESRWSLDFF